MAFKVKFDEAVKNKRLTDIEDTKEAAILCYSKTKNPPPPSLPMEKQTGLRWFL